MPAQTLPEKVWDRHVVHSAPGRAGPAVHRPPPRARGHQPAGLRRPAPGRPARPAARADRGHRGPQRADESTSTSRSPTRSRPARSRCCAENAAEFGITLYPMGDPGQGIVHVIGPEQGRTLPGMTIVCGDSHTATHGAFGALAFGIGTSEVEHVLATQTLPQARPKWMAVEVDGRARRRRHGQGRDPRRHRPDRHRRRDRPRHRVPRLGHPRPVDGGPHDGVQHVDRGRGAGRARRPRRHDVRLPRGTAARPDGRRVGAGARRVAHAAQRRRRGRGTGRSASTRRRCAPQVTWGTNPGAGHVDRRRRAVAGRLRRRRRPASPWPGRSSTWASTPARPIRDIAVDTVFIGSCTNSRIEDLRAAAAVLDGRTVTAKRVMVVPGSHAVKAQAEAEGLDRVFTAAGADWREPGMLDVPGDEPGQAGSPASGRRARATATSRAVRAAAGAPTSCRRPSPRPPPSPATSPPRPSWRRPR